MSKSSIIVLAFLALSGLLALGIVRSTQSRPGSLSDAELAAWKSNNLLNHTQPHIALAPPEATVSQPQPKRGGLKISEREGGKGPPPISYWIRMYGK